jgi:hypothetical protein
VRGHIEVTLTTATARLTMTRGLVQPLFIFRCSFRHNENCYGLVYELFVECQINNSVMRTMDEFHNLGIADMVPKETLSNDFTALTPRKQFPEFLGRYARYTTWIVPQNARRWRGPCRNLRDRPQDIHIVCNKSERMIDGCQRPATHQSIDPKLLEVCQTEEI